MLAVIQYHGSNQELLISLQMNCFQTSTIYASHSPLFGSVAHLEFEETLVAWWFPNRMPWQRGNFLFTVFYKTPFLVSSFVKLQNKLEIGFEFQTTENTF